MSQQTPRRGYNKHKRNPSANKVSDYESDAPYVPDPTPNPQLRSRTNTEINMKVLCKYHPDISHIHLMNNNANVYTFDNAASNWIRTSIEGPAFICTTDGSATNGLPSGYIFIINRKDTTNGSYPFHKLKDVEITERFLLIYFDDAEETCLGLFFHAADPDVRMEFMKKVTEFFRSVKDAQRQFRAAPTEMQPVQAAAAAAELVAPRAEYPISAQLYETQDPEDQQASPEYQHQMQMPAHMGYQGQQQQQYMPMNGGPQGHQYHGY